MFDFKPWARYGGGRSTWYRHVKDRLLLPGVPAPGGRTARLTAELAAVDAAIGRGTVRYGRLHGLRELVNQRRARSTAADAPAPLSAPMAAPDPPGACVSRRDGADELRVSETTFRELPDPDVPPSSERRAGRG